MTQSLTIRSSRTYDVLIGSGLISQAGNLISERLHPSSVVIVSDDNVFPLCGPALYASLETIHVRKKAHSHRRNSRSGRRGGG